MRVNLFVAGMTASTAVFAAAKGDAWGVLAFALLCALNLWVALS